MVVNVYWSCLEDEWMRSAEPQAVYKDFFSKNNLNKTELQMCPAFGDYTKNVFSINSIYDYEIEINNGHAFSPNFDQYFFDSHVNTRYTDNKIIHFSQSYAFFTDKDSLEMSIEHPYLSNTFLSQNCTVIPGKFNIAKWYRPTDMAVILNNNKFVINVGDPLYYIRLHTDEKINFIQYYDSDLLQKFRKSALNSNRYSKRFKKLSNFYSKFNLRNNILNEIQSNIIH